jgi:type IV pilus assembly protein PilA
MKSRTSSNTIPATATTAASKSRQGGFTLIELGLVLLLIAVLGALAVPRVKTFIIEGRVSPTARDVLQAVARIRANAEGGGATPYASVVTATLANTLADRSNTLTVTGVGAAATVTHALGATGATLTAASNTITTAGDSFTTTFNTVNFAACPLLASQIQSTAEAVSINGTVVKSVPAGTAYNGQTAQTACTAGDTNTFVFTFR